MMKLPSLLGLTAFATFCGLCLAAPSQAGTDDRLQRIKTSGEIRVCIWPDYYSITYRNTRTGELEGIDIDMARAFAKDLGVRLAFIDSSFKTLIQDLVDDRCDISMHGIGVTPQRKEKLAFSIPHLKGGIYAITSRNNPMVKRWEDMDKAGVVVAAQAGTYMVDAMKSYLKNATLSVVATPEAREDEVMSGRADVFMTDYPYSRKMLSRHDWALLLTPPQPVAPVPYAYAVAPGDKTWLDAVNAFVRKAKTDGRLLAAAKANGLEGIVDLSQ